MMAAERARRPRRLPPTGRNLRRVISATLRTAQTRGPALPFEAKEDRSLLEAVALLRNEGNSHIPWARVAACVGTRDRAQCRDRHRVLLEQQGWEHKLLRSHDDPVLPTSAVLKHALNPVASLKKKQFATAATTRTSRTFGPPASSVASSTKTAAKGKSLLRRCQFLPILYAEKLNQMRAVAELSARFPLNKVAKRTPLIEIGRKEVQQTPTKTAAIISSSHKLRVSLNSTIFPDAPPLQKPNFCDSRSPSKLQSLPPSMARNTRLITEGTSAAVRAISNSFDQYTSAIRHSLGIAQANRIHTNAKKSVLPSTQASEDMQLYKEHLASQRRQKATARNRPTRNTPVDLLPEQSFLPAIIREAESFSSAAAPSLQEFKAQRALRRSEHFRRNFDSGLEDDKASHQIAGIIKPESLVTKAATASATRFRC